MGIEDFGSITAQSVYEYFKNEDNMNQVKELLQYVTIMQDKPKEIANSKSPFSGTKVYATGTFAIFKKEEIQKLLESLGAEFASGYAKSLSYLIVGSIKGSSKEDKAKKDGVPILTEEQFLKMIGR
jgi:DNA ligase (NAD+)